MTADLASTVNVPVVTWADVLRYLNLDPGTIAAHAVAAVCKRYALDPLLNHVRIVEHQVYVTRDGMIHVAHQSGQLDGIVVEEERRNTDNDGFTAYVSVWRKDMGHPFRYGAQCKDSEPQAKKGDGPAMALARAERRALRRAFDIVAKDGDSEDEPILAADRAGAADHRVVDGDRDGILTCSCGEKFNTAWGWSVHRKEQTGELPAPAAVAEAPADPGRETYKSRKPRRPVETGPPVDYYDNLPEARNMT